MKDAQLLPPYRARRVDKNSTVDPLIIWGGVTLPEFAGYKDNSNIICQYVDCAPCGNFGWCDNNHVCMEQISLEKVFNNIVFMAN